MSVNVLMLTDHCPTQDYFKSQGISDYYNVIWLTSVQWKEAVEDVQKSKDAKFMRSCGAVPKFMALSELFAKHDIKCVIIVGDMNAWTPRIFPLPRQISKKLLHFEDLSKLNVNHISSCVLFGNSVSNFTFDSVLPAKDYEKTDDASSSGEDAVHIEEDPDSKKTKVDSTPSTPSVDRIDRVMEIDKKFPLISVFTSTFNSGKTKLRRALESLLSQSYNNWEWVIINDSPNHQETVSVLKLIAKFDVRIKYFEMGHTGFIGNAKSRATRQCQGDWLVELDHDDRLQNDLLRDIVQIMKLDASVDVIYGDTIAISVDDKELEYFKIYPHTTSFGFGAYYSQFVRNQWHAVNQTTSMNTVSTIDIVGVPNHVRSFSRRAWQKIGGYNFDLYVADDYDIMMRLFLLGTKWVRICGGFSYMQYANVNDDNFTNHRLAMIRHLQGNAAANYRQRTQKLIEGYFEGKKSYKTLLKPPFATGTGCWELPDHSYPRYEYNYMNGRLHAPVREVQMTTSIVSTMKSQGLSCIRHDSTLDLIKLIGQKCLTIVVILPQIFSVGVFVSYVEILASLAKNNAIQILLLSHPKSIFQTIIEGKHDGISTNVYEMIKLFHVWSYNFRQHSHGNACSNWAENDYEKVRGQLINYALKTIVRTSHVLYLEMPLKSAEFGGKFSAESEATINSDITLFRKMTEQCVFNNKPNTMTVSVEDENVFGNDDLNDRVCGSLFSSNRAGKMLKATPTSAVTTTEGEESGQIQSREVHSLNGYYHHTTLPEVFGYAPINTTFNFIDLMKGWIELAAKQ